MDDQLKHDMDTHPAHQKRLAQAVMRRQLSLSLKVAVIFVVMLLGLPIVNYCLPELANTPVFGFTATWLFLAFLFYPITWVLSWWFIRQSNEIEANITSTMRHMSDSSASHTESAEDTRQ